MLLIIYLLAAALGIAVFLGIPGSNPILKILYADVTATLFVWFMGVLLRNASVYDPYWSAAPVVIIPLLDGWLNARSSGALLMSGLIVTWGVRLTAHWAGTFRNLETQDWRYTELKESRPHLWFVTNLFGIHLFPTIMVYLVTIPAYLFILNFTSFNVGILAGACLCVFAIVLQTVSDAQMTRFRRQSANRGRVNRAGLWKSIRHPNYLGEILMWWGVYAMMLSACPRFWFAGAGAVSNTLMFLLVSVPLMEKRQLHTKPEYADYMAQTGMLLPKRKQ